MAEAICWVGLDVHAAQTTVAVMDKDTGQLTRSRVRGKPANVLDSLTGLRGRVIAVYEAGPTGMTLVREARQRGIDMRVCAPGLIPRKPSDRVKTDAKDAEILARQLAAGGLSFVWVPTEQEESLRDLVRAREDVRQELVRGIASASSCCAAIVASTARNGRRGTCTGSANNTSRISPRS